MCRDCFTLYSCVLFTVLYGMKADSVEKMRYDCVTCIQYNTLFNVYYERT